MTASKKMSKCGPRLHSNGMWIKRTQAHCMRKMIDRCVQLAEPNAYPAAGVPCPRQVWIKRQGAINKACSGVMVADNKGKRVGAPGEGDCIIRAQLRCPACQLLRLSGIPNGVSHPAIDLAPGMAPSRHPIGRGKTRVYSNCLFEIGRASCRERETDVGTTVDWM